MQFTKHQYGKTLYTNHVNLYLPRCKGKLKSRQKTHDKILPVHFITIIHVYVSVHKHVQMHQTACGKTSERRNKKLTSIKKSALEDSTQYMSFFLPRIHWNLYFNTLISQYWKIRVLAVNKSACRKENRNVEAFLQAEWRWDLSIRERRKKKLLYKT